MRDFDYFAQDAEIADWQQVVARPDIPEAVREQVRSFRRKAYRRFFLVGLAIALSAVLTFLVFGNLLRGGLRSVPLGAIVLLAFLVMTGRLVRYAWRYWRKGPFAGSGADAL
jgi:membrane glycosyltransferase